MVNLLVGLTDPSDACFLKLFRMGLKDWLEWFLPITKAWPFVLPMEYPMKISRRVKALGIHLLKVLCQLFLSGSFSPGLVKFHSTFVKRSLLRILRVTLIQISRILSLCISLLFGNLLHKFCLSCSLQIQIFVSSKTLKFSPSCPSHRSLSLK